MKQRYESQPRFNNDDLSKLFHSDQFVALCRFKMKLIRVAPLTLKELDSLCFELYKWSWDSIEQKNDFHINQIAKFATNQFNMLKIDKLSSCDSYTLSFIVFHLANLNKAKLNLSLLNEHNVDTLKLKPVVLFFNNEEHSPIPVDEMETVLFGCNKSKNTEGTFLRDELELPAQDKIRLCTLNRLSIFNRKGLFEPDNRSDSFESSILTKGC